MSRDHYYYVYILSNRKNGTLYTGVTSKLKSRLSSHRALKPETFTGRYGVTRLVYYEVFRDITNAIGREKQIKKGSRAKKIELIEAENPEWNDLAADWF